MNTLLVFFAIPLATIILSAIFETFINSPLKVSGIFFSIFIVVAFALGGTAELILAAIIYTVISFIVSLIVHILINHCHRIYENGNEEISNTCNCYADSYSTDVNSTNTITENTGTVSNTLIDNSSRCNRRYR